jgi:hypothetical protein
MYVLDLLYFSALSVLMIASMPMRQLVAVSDARRRHALRGRIDLRCIGGATHGCYGMTGAVRL